MGRPAKSVKTQSRHNTKTEESERLEVEEKIRGKSEKLLAPRHLTDPQKKIFYWIKSELEDSEILSNLDKYILAQFAIAVDRLQAIEMQINNDFSLICDKGLMSSKDKYTKDLYRCCNELCLSPQARAKIGSLSLKAQSEKSDPLTKILGKLNNGE